MRAEASMAREIITTPRAGRTRSPLSQAVKVGGLVFVSGTTAYTPDGSLAKDFEGQMRQVMENIKVVLEAAGTSLDRAVKMNVLLARAADFAVMNEIYATYFEATNYPARTTIEATLARPELLVEIECVAEAPERAGSTTGP
jgi:2-iminobutanoate/2-iminopropanoate deaminase